MDSNDIFSVKRFLMLFRQSLTINMKTIAISVAGFFGLVFILLIYLQLTTGLSGWDNKDSFRVFVFLFFAIGLIYVGMAFPSFRSKGKSIAFLMFPSSTLEKYLLEFITRIIAFVVLMPLLFWIAANIEGAFIHLWSSSMKDHTFSFNEPVSKFFSRAPNEQWEIMAFIQGTILAFLAVFAGGAYFSKSPFLKTMFIIMLTGFGIFLYIHLLGKAFDIDTYGYRRTGILFIKHGNVGAGAFSVLAMIANLSLLAISWFSLKEKEV